MELTQPNIDEETEFTILSTIVYCTGWVRSFFGTDAQELSDLEILAQMELAKNDYLKICEAQHRQLVEDYYNVMIRNIRRESGSYYQHFFVNFK